MPTINGRACVANGRNLIVQSDLKIGYLAGSTGGVQSSDLDFYSENYIATNGVTVFTLSSPDYELKGNFDNDRIAMYDSDKNYLGWQRITSPTQTLSKSNVAYIRFSINSKDEGNTTSSAANWLANHRYKLEKGSVATPLTPAPVDKVFSNGVQVYGRNRIRGSEFDSHWAMDSRVIIVDGYDGHKAIHADTTTLTSVSVDVSQSIYNGDVQLIKPGEWYTISFYAKGTGTIRTHIYPTVVDSAAGQYVDGIFRNGLVPSDGGHDWTLTDEYVRHSWSFKAKTPLSVETNNGNMLFRTIGGNSTYVSLPKLEQGTIATPWTPATEDVM